ncbi:DNA ligase/mRNA capping enzyme, partial [Rozella allomycis CSF55]
YSIKNDLKVACMCIQKFKDIGLEYDQNKSVDLNKEFSNPELGVNVGIMQCGRPNSLEYVANKLQGQECLIETKYDEAEILVYNERTKSIEPFGGVSDLAPGKSFYSNDVTNGIRHYILIFFDILYLNGEGLLNCTLRNRRLKLEQVVQTIPNYCELSKTFIIDFSKLNHLDLLRNVFQEHIQKNEEGIIVKSLDSIYKPFNRTNWWKIKKDCRGFNIDGYGDTGDFAIVGASYAPNADSSGLFQIFHVGCLTNKKELLDKISSCPNFAIVFTVEMGLSRDERSSISALINNTSIKFHNGLKLPNREVSYQITNLINSKIDVILSIPLVFELLGSGFTKERPNKFFTLRFPRILKVYYNRNPIECITFQELQELSHSRNKIETTPEIDYSSYQPGSERKSKRAKTVTDLVLDFAFLSKAHYFVCYETPSAETMSITKNIVAWNLSYSRTLEEALGHSNLKIFLMDKNNQEFCSDIVEHLKSVNADKLLLLSQSSFLQQQSSLKNVKVTSTDVIYYFK